MATKIVTKNSSTASAVPTASDLVQGELAVNVADKRLFTEDNGGSIVELGTNPSTLAVDTDTLYVDSTNNRVGVGLTSPLSDLHVKSAEPQVLISDASNPSNRFLAFDVGLDADEDTHFITVDQADALAFGEKLEGDDRVIENEWMRITNAGNVGIGTSSPQSDGNTTNLEVSSAFGARVLIANTDTNGRKYGFYSSNSGIFGLADYTASGTPTRMAIDSSGNVGMGTSAIMQDFGGGRTTLALKGTGTADYSTLQLGNYGTSSNDQIHGLINFYDGTTSVSRIQSVRASNTSDANLAFYTAPSSGGITERARLTSDGNLNIGTTGDVTSTNAGVQLRADNTIRVAKSGASAMSLYRHTNDGSIISFYKDGTSVGSVGVSGGNNLFISGQAADHAGLTFATQSVLPTTQGAINNNTVDLGQSGNAFKDLYFAGRMYGNFLRAGETLPSSTDFNDLKTSGFYRVDNNATNAPSTAYHALVIYGNSSNVVTQIATSLQATTTYVRSFNSAWTSWARLDT